MSPRKPRPDPEERSWASSRHVEKFRAALAAILLLCISNGVLFATTSRTLFCNVELNALYESAKYTADELLSVAGTNGVFPRDDDPTIGFYVISLQGVSASHDANSGRLDQFRADWDDMCGSNNKIDFQVCPGNVHPSKGYGVTFSFIDCFERAIASNASMAYFFEDDARLFNTSLGFCRPEFHSDLYRKLPEDLFALLLGGHHWQMRDTKVTKNGTSGIRRPDGFVPLDDSFGAYGFGLPRHNLEPLRTAFLSDIVKAVQEQDDFIKPDREWYTHAQTSQKTIYAAKPLIVGHPGGWSNTWKKYRDEAGIDPFRLSKSRTKEGRRPVTWGK